MRTKECAAKCYAGGHCSDKWDTNADGKSEGSAMVCRSQGVVARVKVGANPR